MDNESDALLLERARQGDPSGLSHIYARYHDRILWYSLRLMNDRQQAEDIAQNVFLKVLTRQQTIRNGQSLQSWLFTVARNEAYTELAKHKPAVLDETAVWAEPLPDEALIARERDELVDAVLEHLYLPFREVLILRIYEQLSYAEIAHITGTTVPSVKSRLVKARRALVAKLHHQFKERLL